MCLCIFFSFNMQTFANNKKERLNTMKKTKKMVALLMATTMVASVAGCGSSSNNSADTTAKTDDAATEKTEEATTEEKTDDAKADDAAGSGTISFSWWGGDSRHEATIAACDKFTETTGIEVKTQYAAWSGWEESMATAFSTGTAPDVNQINWNWISSFSSDGSVFADINEYKDIIDLTQFDSGLLEQCTVADKLQAVPISVTGRLFYWNKATFDKAGIEIPTTVADLKAAGETFKTTLGDEYYPLALGEYDRMIITVFYLESKYNKPWVADGQVQYTVDEVKEGLEFIKSLEDAHALASIETITGDGAESIDKNPKWMNGQYAGIFEWDSAASKYQSSLAEGQEFVVGDYLTDMGDTKGGFSKISMAFAISETAKDKESCAKLINFLLNEEEGVKLMKSERGIPASAAGLQICKDNSLLNETVAEANAKVLSWVTFALDPLFEDASLKNSPDGVYYDVFGGLSYGEYSVDEAAQKLVDGVTETLSK